MDQPLPYQIVSRVPGQIYLMSKIEKERLGCQANKEREKNERKCESPGNEDEPANFFDVQMFGFKHARSLP